MKTILVTGGNGQLARCIKDISGNYPEYSFVFKNSSQLDITDKHAVDNLFKNNGFDFCINCAAYTNVEKAESEPEKAHAINTDGPRHLAMACKVSNVVLMHISTDYVFDGEKGRPYLEEDVPKPLNVYGQTKLQGEMEIQSIWQKYFIIRTSWLFSEYGNNFVKTILSLSKIKEEIEVVDDQVGCPTYARDLAEVIMNIIVIDNSADYGLYHYCNSGEVSRYVFTKEILRKTKEHIKTTSIKNIKTCSNVKRPKNSTLSCNKLSNIFGITINNWENSYKEFLNKLYHA